MQSGDTTRGRSEFAAIIAVGAAGLLSIGLVDWRQGGEVNWLTTLGRPIVFVGLGALAWRGRLWARTVVALWLGLIGALLLGRSIAMIGSGSTAGAMWIAIGVLFIASVVLLYRSPHIRAALAERHRATSGATIMPPAA